MTQTPPQASNPPESGESGQKPVEPRSPVVPAAPPATSTIEYAVSTLGDLLNAAFTDARNVDQYARQVISAFGDIDHDQRIALGDLHPGLVEALLLLENQIGRVDERMDRL